MNYKLVQIEKDRELKSGSYVPKNFNNQLQYTFCSISHALKARRK